MIHYNSNDACFRVFDVRLTHGFEVFGGADGCGADAADSLAVDARILDVIILENEFTNGKLKLLTFSKRIYK